MKQLKGPDVDIETSLKEYGFAWQFRKDETVFYYEVTYNGEEYTRFDSAVMENNIDLHYKFDWIEFADVAKTAGMTLTEWDEMPLTQKVQSLLSHYGYENIFGTSYTEGETYLDITANDD